MQRERESGGSGRGVRHIPRSGDRSFGLHPAVRPRVSRGVFGVKRLCPMCHTELLPGPEKVGEEVLGRYIHVDSSSDELSRGEAL
jgi:hypothetical protein